jgi:hypothetical protein
MNNDNKVNISIEIDLDELVIQLRKKLDNEELYCLMQEISLQIKNKKYIKEFRDYLNEYLMEK